MNYKEEIKNLLKDKKNLTEPCSLEIAKILKENGFNENCEYFYLDKNIQISIINVL